MAFARLALVTAVMLLGLGLALMPQRASAQGGVAPSTDAEDLLQIYEQARSADPLLAAAEAQRGIRAEQAVQARAALLPQWALVAEERRGTADGSREGIVASQLSMAVLDLSRLRELDAARLEITAQQARVRAAEQDLCARVARGYLGVLLAQAGLATAQANQAALAAHVAQLQSRVAAGLSAEVDLQQSQAAHELARAGTAQSAQALADARQALAQVSGRPPGALRPLAAQLPALPPEPADPLSWAERARASHPLLQAQALGAAALDQRVQAARAAHWPTVSVDLDSQRRSSNLPAISGSDTAIALRLRVPLFAGGATQSLVRQAAYERDLQRAETEISRRAITREAHAQYQAVVAGVAALQSTGNAVTAANAALASTRAGHALGTRSNTDLLLAIQTQAAAQNAHEQARHGHVLARLLLLQAVGQLGAAELAAANRLLHEEGK